MSASANIRILIVDDEPIVRSSLEHWFRDEGCVVESAASAKEALSKLASSSWDLFLVDIRMPGMDGLELQARIRETHRDAIVIVMTAYASVETAVQAMKQGAHDYITKPFDPEQLEKMVRAAIEKRRLQKENVQLKRSLEEMEQFSEIIGNTPAIAEVLGMVESVAETDATVLIRGESGTGKELVARAIHAHSRRRYMPIVVVNCGALPDGVLESELFGHEKGAFTGAQYRRKGKFEMADGGSLFLDEIGDVSLKTQMDLLRVLEEKAIYRVGGNVRIPVDFRTIAATNRDLEAAVADKTFREDLYYRLNVFTIRIPPLRERREDIPVLADHFLKRFARSMNRPLTGFSPAAMKMLQEREWPGNVRELQNAIERAAVLRPNGEIQLEDFPFAQAAEETPEPGAKSLQELEKSHIQRILKETNGNISQAARILEIDRVTLYNKLRKYGIERK
ncbi:MAG: sigma-54-dependent transcriptional regulator [Candidatus Eisenbacteria bacterium]